MRSKMRFQLQHQEQAAGQLPEAEFVWQPGSDWMLCTAQGAASRQPGVALEEAPVSVGAMR